MVDRATDEGESGKSGQLGRMWQAVESIAACLARPVLLSSTPYTTCGIPSEDTSRPNASFLAKLATSALVVGLGAASYAVAPPGGVYYVPTGNPVLTARYKASQDAARFTYVFTEKPDVQGKTGFSLVKVDKETGQEVARVWFPDRSPSYRLDPVRDIVVIAEGRQLRAERFLRPAT